MRYNIFAWDPFPIGHYGVEANDSLADSIDFYMDSLFWLHNPQCIVEQGRWTEAFHTKFYKMDTCITSDAMDTLLDTIPRFSGMYYDSVKLNTGDLIAIIAFRENPALAEFDKYYAAFLVTDKIDLDTLKRIYFTYKMQTAENYRLLRDNP